MKFLKKKYWVITCLLLVIFLLFLVYYYYLNDYCEGATTVTKTTGNTITSGSTAATTTATKTPMQNPGQILINGILVNEPTCKTDKTSNSYRCMVNISNKLFTGKTTKSKLIEADSTQTTLNNQIMQYNPKSEKYNSQTVNNTKTACSMLGKVIAYAPGNDTNLRGQYQGMYRANCPL